MTVDWRVLALVTVSDEAYCHSVQGCHGATQLENMQSGNLRLIPREKSAKMWPCLWCVQNVMWLMQNKQNFSCCSWNAFNRSVDTYAFTHSGGAIWWMFMGWRPGVVDWGGRVFAGCLPRVQLFVSTCNGRPHLALQHHWLLRINYHFDDC